MASFKLNRLAHKAQTATEAANHAGYYKQLTWQERLSVAGYLTSIAYNFNEANPPKMNKAAFKVKART